MSWSRAFGMKPRLEWDPFREFERMQSEMDALFGRSTESMPEMPPLNAWESDEGVVVTAEIPGLDPAGIDISVEGDVLTVSGDRAVDEAAEDARHLRRERGFGRFSRSLRLPLRIQEDEVQAHAKNGVLWVKLPKARVERPRRIEVQAH